VDPRYRFTSFGFTENPFQWQELSSVVTGVKVVMVVLMDGGTRCVWGGDLQDSPLKLHTP